MQRARQQNRHHKETTLKKQRGAELPCGGILFTADSPGECSSSLEVGVQ